MMLSMLLGLSLRWLTLSTYPRSERVENTDCKRYYNDCHVRQEMLQTLLE
jgi:hypothetical protein